MTELPAVHSAVKARFIAAGPTDAVRLYPVKLDVKQAEFARCLLINGRQSVFTDQTTGAIPCFVSTDPAFESTFITARPPVSIVLDFHDKGRKFDFLGITDAMWSEIATHQLQVIYLKLQIHDPSRYAALNRLPQNVHVLSCPLLLGGSRFHITVQDDFAGDALFSRLLQPNPSPMYEYDWSFVGAPTSDDRAAAFDVLKPFESRRRFFTVSQPGHADASVATVPHGEYLRISRASKVCLSLNGRGPWCLKDGELLSADCLVLRQWHPVLTLNPLTPRDGEHWVVSKTEDLVGTIESLLADDVRRERIRSAGHQMFADVLLRSRWADVYVASLLSFLKTRDKKSWGALAIA
ncbi:hypothetical protein BH10PLA1_BH10PLA1_00630 [soil metagenome]